MTSSLGITLYPYDNGGRLTEVAVDQKEEIDSRFYFAATYSYERTASRVLWCSRSVAERTPAAPCSIKEGRVCGSSMQMQSK